MTNVKLKLPDHDVKELFKRLFVSSSITEKTKYVIISGSSIIAVEKNIFDKAEIQEVSYLNIFYPKTIKVVKLTENIHSSLKIGDIILYDENTKEYRLELSTGMYWCFGVDYFLDNYQNFEPLLLELPLIKAATGSICIDYILYEKLNLSIKIDWFKKFVQYMRIMKVKLSGATYIDKVRITNKQIDQIYDYLIENNL